MLHVRLLLCVAVLSAAVGTRTITAQPACGTERWAVKVWDDRDSSQVDTVPVPSSIDVLARMPIPEVIYPSAARIPPHELRTYRFRAIIDRIVTESDGDWHLILRDPQDPLATLIAEIPSPLCTRSATKAAIYAAARDSLRRVPRRGIAEITGIGFWDFLHNQRGGARNGFELHPILLIVPERRP